MQIKFKYEGDIQASEQFRELENVLNGFLGVCITAHFNGLIGLNHNAFYMNKLGSS